MTGILLIDKAEGWTSHDVVAKLRGILKTRRIGHAGTLDPLATGLLTIFIGAATKAVQFAEAEEKTYIAHLKLGTTTDTQDITGTVLSETPQNITKAQLEAVLPQFTGDILQVPPMYSALKIDGERLYKLARKGVEVERKPRPITVRQIRVQEQLDDGFLLEVTCSKGTYIRTLCHDIGQALAVGGVMKTLRRTAVGSFSVTQAHSIETLQNVVEKEELLLPLDDLFAAYPAVKLNAKQEQKLRYGQVFSIEMDTLGLCRVYSETGQFLSLAEISAPDGKLTSVKNFFGQVGG